MPDIPPPPIPPPFPPAYKGKAPYAFVSYAHADSSVVYPEIDRLHKLGYRLWYDEGIVAGDAWAAAVQAALEAAACFLVFLSPQAVESKFVFNEIHSVCTRGNKPIIPVFLEPTALKHGLDVLIGSLQRILKYELPAERYRSLLHRALPEHLGGDCEVPKPSDAFAISIREHMATLHRTVERLTREQCGVLNRLHGKLRVRIRGCAGSGKTLVAAQKAILLSKAGLVTLFLCHNPLLAEHVRQLTRGHQLQVESFGAWVAGLANEGTTNSQSPWTIYEEPDDKVVERLAKEIAGSGSYQAVVVDEGQDFRKGWWDLVEASLDGSLRRSASSGVLYIFNDDLQAVLPHRAAYPETEVIYDLSANCRNGGKVYDLMRHFHPHTPDPKDELKKFGTVVLLTYDRGDERAVVEKAVRCILCEPPGASTVALYAGNTPIEQTALSGTYFIRDRLDWQTEVRRQFRQAITTAKHLRAPDGGQKGVDTLLDKLSEDRVPNSNDVELVCQAAKLFTVPKDLRKWLVDNPGSRKLMVWQVNDDRLILSKPSRKSLLRASEIIMHFEQKDWHAGIPDKCDTVCFMQHTEPRSVGMIPVYPVASYKGLEADIVLFHIEGPVPISTSDLYVGISRATMLLVLVVDNQIAKSCSRVFWLLRDRD